MLMARFRGSFTALVTPFSNGVVDEKAFREHVNWQIEEGTHGLVPVGTTGESPTLTHAEHKRVVEICVEEAAGPRARSSPAPARTTPPRRSTSSRHAEKAGADAVLIVTPYYNKPTPGRPLPALQGDQRRDRHPDLHLQHPRPLGDRHVGRDDGAARRASPTSPE